MKSDKKNTNKTNSREGLTLAPLDFEDALEDLLQVKPEKKIVAPKKKRKPTSKK